MICLKGSLVICIDLDRFDWTANCANILDDRLPKISSNSLMCFRHHQQGIQRGNQQTYQQITMLLTGMTRGD